MSLKKTSKSGHGTLNELNITPLLDLAFVLLVIFIITTPQLMNNLEMNLPSAQKPAPTNAPPKLPGQILVSATGKVTLNGQPYSLAELRPALAQLKASDADLAVVVKGDRAVDYQHVISVLDLLQQLDIAKVGLATEAVP
jgi:biopolymer transport protein ExbD